MVNQFSPGAQYTKKHTGCWETTLLEDIASALEGCSKVMVAASQVGSWVGLDSLEDLNQPNILIDYCI